MKRTTQVTILLVTAILTLLFWIYYFCYYKEGSEETFVPAPSRPNSNLVYGNIPVDSFMVEEYTVKQGEFLSQILVNLNADESQIAQINLMNPNTFDVRTVRAGNTYKAFYSGDATTKRLSYFVYEKSPVAFAVFTWNDSLSVRHGEKAINRHVKQCDVEITSSLWNAVVGEGISPILAMNLSDVYAWTIDFFGLQKGDRFKAVYEELYVDTTFYSLGKIFAAEFMHNNKTYQAYYFVQDSVDSYWSEEGNSLRRAFLKAPLTFSRISSHFTYARNHPVLRIVRPHTGVDYAAPMGTPVVSIGDGTVISKGYQGGGGHTVKIQHNSVYTTAYLHLSKYGEGIQNGSRVAQGQVIGYVGSSGLSTGPHLDFRVWMNGKPVDPLTIESPSVEPIREENKLAFDSVVATYRRQLGSYKVNDSISIP